MRLDLNLVEVFCCVKEEGSFSRAAEKLYLTQPTVSGHIKNLEDYIGARVFNRHPRRITLTRAGELLYKHGRIILGEKQAAIQELKRFLNCMEGSLTLSGSTIPAEYILPQLVASFHSIHPAVIIDIRVSDSKTVCEEVLEGKADIGFVGAKLDAIGLEFRPVSSDRLVLVVPNNEQWLEVDCITLERLLSIPFLSREAGSGTRMSFEKSVGRSIEEFNVVGRFGSTGALKESLKAGLGVAVLSRLAVDTELSTGVLRTVRIEGVDEIRRQFYTVRNRNLTTSPIAESFLCHALATSSNVDRFVASSG